MLGIISALGASGSWTYACFLWRRQTKYLSASQINIIKNIIAFTVFLPVIFTFEARACSTALTPLNDGRIEGCILISLLGNALIRFEGLI